LRSRFDKCFEFYRSQVNCVHGSTTNAGFIDTIRVPYNGENVPIRDMGWTSPKDSVVVVRLHDPAAIPAALQSIKTAGLTAYSTKTDVVVTIPRPSLDTIEKNKKRCRELAEDGKVAMRKVRQEFRDLSKKLPDDERKAVEKQIQQSLDEGIARIDTDCEAKIKTF
jgi:ribosome recycling factor